MAKRKSKTLGVALTKKQKLTLDKALSSPNYTLCLLRTFNDGKANFRVLAINENLTFVNYDGDYFMWDLEAKDGLYYGPIMETKVESCETIPWEEVNILREEPKVAPKKKPVKKTEKVVVEKPKAVKKTSPKKEVEKPVVKKTTTKKTTKAPATKKTVAKKSTVKKEKK